MLQLVAPHPSFPEKGVSFKLDVRNAGGKLFGELCKVMWDDAWNPDAVNPEAAHFYLVALRNARRWALNKYDVNIPVLVLENVGCKLGCHVGRKAGSFELMERLLEYLRD